MKHWGRRVAGHPMTFWVVGVAVLLGTAGYRWA